MDTEKLIAALADRAEPVRPLPRPAVRWALWLAAAVPLVAAGAWALGVRGDIAEAVSKPEVRVAIGLGLVAALTAAAAAMLLAVPGRDASGWRRQVPVALLGLWTVVLLVLSFGQPGTYAAAAAWPWTACWIKVAAVGALPAALTWWMARRGAPLDPAWTAALATGAGWALAAVAVQFSCPNDHAAHLLLTHLAPVVAGGLLAAAFGRRWLTASAS